MNQLVLKAAAFTALCSFALLLFWLKLQTPFLLLYTGLVFMAAIATAVIGLVISEDDGSSFWD